MPKTPIQCYEWHYGESKLCHQWHTYMYHALRGIVTAALASKGGSASLHSERQLKPSVTYLLDGEISFQINPVAQRTSRVAKQLGRWINIYLPTESSEKHQKRAI